MVPRLRSYRERVRRSSPSLLRPSATSKLLTPVMLPPGRFKLATRPNLIGSSAVVNTMGIIAVAALAACAAGVLVAAMTVTLRWIRSAASAGNRSYCPSAQRYSIVVF